MPPWQNTLSIGADDAGFHFTVGRPMANVGNTSGSWFLFNLLLHSTLKRTFKTSSETHSFSETSRSRDETETSHLRDRDFEKSCPETETCLETLQLWLLPRRA